MSKKRIHPIAEGSDWTVDAIERYDKEIGRVAKAYGLDCYRHQLEIITAEQMMDAYASIGMPVYYHHWSFGKHFLETENRYKRGQMGLAYEIVINSDPCIAYLMEENTLTMQALVIAHAAYGHNSFFKGNPCSSNGPAPMPSSIIWSSPGATSPNARNATVSTPSSAWWMPATP